MLKQIINSLKNRTLTQSILCLFLSSAAFAEQVENSPIEIRLVSNVKAIGPSQRFFIGIHQKMLPGYHTYWKNAGTVGLPTSVEWDLPEGWSAGEINWPVPQVTRMAVYDVWGYEEEVLLPIQFTPPDILSSDKPVVLKGRVTWMCCGKICRPGTREFQITLPVSDQPLVDSQWKESFNRILQEQPQSDSSWELKCVIKEGSYRLSFVRADSSFDESILSAYFFGYQRQVSSAKGQVFKPDEKGFSIHMKPEEHTIEPLPRLSGMVVVETDRGRKVVAVDVAIEVFPDGTIEAENSR